MAVGQDRLAMRDQDELHRKVEQGKKRLSNLLKLCVPRVTNRRR
jgi:hypothetical protein